MCVWRTCWTQDSMVEVLVEPGTVWFKFLLDPWLYGRKTCWTNDGDVWVLVWPRHVWREYWRTHYCVVGVPVEPRTVWLDYWLNPGLCDWSTGWKPGLCCGSTGWTQYCVIGVLVETKTVLRVLVEPRTVCWEYWLNPELGGCCTCWTQYRMAVKILVKPRTVCWEYWLTQSWVDVVLVELSTVWWLEYWLNPWLWGGSTGMY